MGFDCKVGFKMEVEVEQQSRAAIGRADWPPDRAELERWIEKSIRIRVPIGPLMMMIGHEFNYKQLQA